MSKILPYERYILLLTLGFVVFTGVTFLLSESTASQYTITTSKKPPLLEQSHSSPAPPSNWPESLLPGEQIHLNKAKLADLQRLPGVGHTKAQAIVKYRNQHGPFQTVEDLTQVSGIGPATLEQLRPYITVD